jgi:hypothetical protein
MDLRFFHIFPLRRERGMTNKTFLLTSWIIMGNLRQEGIVKGVCNGNRKQGRHKEEYRRQWLGLRLRRESL